MKNLYLIIAVFCLGKIYSQDLQNANWIFGDNAWLNFNSGMVIPEANLPIIPLDLIEGCASASDTNGELLFWSNGRSVFRWDGTAAATLTGGNNTLNGDLSSAQNVMVVPWPDHPGMYFLLTVAQETPVTGVAGLYWSIVDINTNTVTNLNTPLLDMDGVPITAGYGMISEAFTSALAENNTDYWIVAQVDRLAGSATESLLLSYPVTALGIGDTNPNMPITSAHTEGMGLSLKISPDRLWIGLGKQDSTPYLGNFNHANGEISNLQLLGSGSYSYSVEFSPNSQNMYFTTPPSGIFGIDLDSPTQVRELSKDEAYGLQRALNERIYISRKGQLFVSELQNPNDFSNPMYNEIVPLNGRTAEGGFPQWLWEVCIATLYDFNDIVITDRSEEREHWIRNYNYIADDRRAIYHAGEFVELLPDFEAEYGSQFAAYIEKCSGDFQYKPSTDANPKTKTRTILGNDIMVYPNPTANLLNIKSDRFEIASFIVTTIDGKIVHTQKTNGKENQIDVSGYAKGVYLLAVQTVDGQTLNTKFIKN